MIWYFVLMAWVHHLFDTFGNSRLRKNLRSVLPLSIFNCFMTKKVSLARTWKVILAQLSLAMLLRSYFQEGEERSRRFYQLNKYRQILFGSGIFFKRRRWAFYSEFSYFFGKPCCLYSFVLYYQQDNVCPTTSLSLIGEPSISDFGKRMGLCPNDIC